MLPWLPASSTTMAFKLLLSVKVVARVHTSGLAVAVASVQVLPLLDDSSKVSELCNAVVKVALTVWAVWLVMKSLLLMPLSALKANDATVVVGAVVSTK